MEKLQLAIKETDIVILAVPVNVIVEILPKILDVVSDTTTVMDVGSTKELICKVVANHVKRKQFVPSHPMAGTENSGPTAALQGLFNQKKVIICDKNQTNIEHLNRVKAIYSTLQSKLIYLSSKDHDRYIAYISHLSHVSSFALANTVLEQEDSTMIVNLAGGGFQSTVRLAKSSPEMWVPIFQQNKEHIIEAVDSYIAHLSTFRENIKSEDTKEIQKFLENGNKIKEIFK
jgi:prephenate dehydrogenase